LINIIIIKLIINLISWYYYSCSTQDCISRLKIYSVRAVWWTWKMYINSHKKHLHKDLALIA